MSIRGRAKPSKGMSLSGLIGGIVCIFVGLFFMGLNPPPQFAAFIVLWIIVVIAIIAFHAYNALSEKGVSLYDVDVRMDEKGSTSVDKLDEDLRKLAKLRDDGLISDEEFKKKRDEIMRG